MSTPPLRMSRTELNEFLETLGLDPKVHGEIETVEPGLIRVRMPFHVRLLRMGNTISGPTLMGLADRAMYLLVQTVAGPVVEAVTTSLHIDFLRRPARSDVIAEARLLRSGRRLVVGDVFLYSDGDARPVARASVTYALPADGAGAEGA